MIDWSQVKHFTRAEFGPDHIEPDPMMVSMLDQARRMAGIPFVINSGIRTPERNAAVGGAPTSAHLTGHAVDIRCTDSRSRYLIVKSCMRAGFSRIGIASGFVHVDNDPDKEGMVIWTYQ